MKLSTKIYLLGHQLGPTSGLSAIDNGIGVPVFGTEDTMVDYALLATDKKATLPSQVQNSKHSVASLTA